MSSLTDFGAFVDLGGGIEGLVHVSELSRRRVEHPKELLRSGQEVKVSVLKIEKNGRRISLSMKRLEPDPWKGVADRFPPGQKFSGKIMRQTDFGLFVELEPGLEGLVHTSRLGLGMSLEHESLQVGNQVDVRRYPAPVYEAIQIQPQRHCWLVHLIARDDVTAAVAAGPPPTLSKRAMNW